MIKKSVCVSFDYTTDKHLRFLLWAWNEREHIPFSFNDVTPSEIQSKDYGVVKLVLSRKINEAEYLLVLVGKYANRRAWDSDQIGDINWMNWEINKAKGLGKKLIGVKTEREYDSPTALLGSNVTWAYALTVDSVSKALREV